MEAIMPSPLHYWPVCHREWMASSTIQAMGNASKGMYFHLCMIQWEDEKLPKDDAKLKRLVQGTARDWREFKEFLDHCFPICDDGFRRNGRVAKDRETCVNRLILKQDNGRKGGRPPKPKVFETGTEGPHLDNQIEPNSKSKSELKSKTKLNSKENASFCSKLVTLLYEIPAVARCGKQTEDLSLSLKKILDAYPWVPESEWERIVDSAIDGAIQVPAWKASGTAIATPRQLMEKRSEERRVGKECRCTCRSRWSPYH